MLRYTEQWRGCEVEHCVTECGPTGSSGFQKDGRCVEEVEKEEGLNQIKKKKTVRMDGVRTHRYIRFRNEAPTYKQLVHAIAL